MTRSEIAIYCPECAEREFSAEPRVGPLDLSLGSDLTSARVTPSPLSLVLLQGSRRCCGPVGRVPARLPESRPQQRQGLDGARNGSPSDTADPERNVGSLDRLAQPLRRDHDPEGTDRA
jgi:hypothetical protein